MATRIQREMEMRHAVANGRFVAQQDRRCDLLVDQNLRGAQYFVLFALREHDALGRLLRFVDHDAHHALHFAQAAFQLFAIFEKIDGLLRHAGIHGRFRHGGGFAQQHARIERLRDDVFRAEFQTLHAVGAAHRIGHFLARQFGQRVRGRQLHRVVDGGGPNVQRAAEDERKAQNVVHLIGIVGAAGGDNGVRPGFHRHVIRNFGIGIRQRKNDGPSAPWPAAFPA